MTVQRTRSTRVAVSEGRETASGARIDAVEQMAPITQTIVIPDFPDPALARALSPNGRAHWGAKTRAKVAVKAEIWAAVKTRIPPLVPVPPPACVTYRWIVPDRTQRDLDNHGTGVVKVLQDWLVKDGWFPGGDHSEVLESHVEIIYEKGQRRMEIVLDPQEALR